MTILAVAFVLGGLAVALAALVERVGRRGDAPVTADAPSAGDLDTRLRAGFARAVAPWLITSAAAFAAVALALLVTGPSAGAGVALVAGGLVAAAVARGAAGALTAAQVASAGAATWFMHAQAAAAAGAALAAAFPVAVAGAGVVASGLGAAAARANLRPELGDEEGPALARALVRPAVVAPALLLVAAELALARLDVPGADAMRLPIAAGVVLAVAVTAGAPWSLPARAERGGRLLRLGGVLRPPAVLAALVAAAAALALATRGAPGLTLLATTVTALLAAPLGAATFCERGAAPELARALRRRAALVAAALALSSAGALTVAALRAAPTADLRQDGGGPRMTAPPGPERDE